MIAFLIAILIATEDRLSAALIRYVIKSSARGAFDAGEIIDLAATRFGEVSAELIARKRKEWRRATMEVHYAKLRVKELYEAQQQVGTFAVEQARSLVLALGIEGQPPTTMVPEAESIVRASRHDAPGFLAGELERRRALSYPPFSTLIRIVCSSEKPGLAQEAAAGIQGRIPGSLGPAPLFRLRGRERSQVVVKAPERRPAVAAVGVAVDEVAAKWGRKGVSFSVDVDPQ